MLGLCWFSDSWDASWRTKCTQCTFQQGSNMFPYRLASLTPPLHIHEIILWHAIFIYMHVVLHMLPFHIIHLIINMPHHATCPKKALMSSYSIKSSNWNESQMDLWTEISRYVKHQPGWDICISIGMTKTEASSMLLETGSVISPHCKHSLIVL